MIAVGKDCGGSNFLIIKEESDRRIKNEIGHIMKKYNVIEYKSPEDALIIDDFIIQLGVHICTKNIENV